MGGNEKHCILISIRTLIILSICLIYLKNQEAQFTLKVNSNTNRNFLIFFKAEWLTIQAYQNPGQKGYLSRLIQ